MRSAHSWSPFSVNAADAAADFDAPPGWTTPVAVAGILLCVAALGSVGDIVHAADNFFGVAATTPFIIVKHPVQPVVVKGLPEQPEARAP